jgi:hypothetical protein
MCVSGSQALMDRVRVSDKMCQCMKYRYFYRQVKLWPIPGITNELKHVCVIVKLMHCHQN